MLDSPLWGTAIGLTVPAVGFVASVAWTPRGPRGVSRRRSEGMRFAVVLMALGGVASGVGALARTVSIDLVAVPLLQTTSL